MDHDCVSGGEREDHNHVPGGAIKDNDYVPGVYIMSCHGGWILIDSKGGS